MSSTVRAAILSALWAASGRGLALVGGPASPCSSRRRIASGQMIELWRLQKTDFMPRRILRAGFCFSNQPRSYELSLTL